MPRRFFASEESYYASNRPLSAETETADAYDRALWYEPFVESYESLGFPFLVLVNLS